MLKNSIARDTHTSLKIGLPSIEAIKSKSNAAVALPIIKNARSQLEHNLLFRQADSIRAIQL